MLLVNNHQTELSNRGEHGRTRPDDDGGFSLLDAMPTVITFAGAQTAV